MAKRTMFQWEINVLRGRPKSPKPLADLFAGDAGDLTTAQFCAIQNIWQMLQNRDHRFWEPLTDTGMFEVVKAIIHFIKKNLYNPLLYPTIAQILNHPETQDMMCLFISGRRNLKELLTQEFREAKDGTMAYNNLIHLFNEMKMSVPERC